MAQKIRALIAAAAAIATAGLTGAAGAQSAEKELTIWTMGGDQPGWVAWLEEIGKNFEANNPGASVKITYYDKAALGVALKTALPAGEAPDLFYTEPDQREYADSGYLQPLDDLVNWDNVESWARGAWTSNGHVWGVPYGAYTNQIYYNKALMAELGVTIPPTGQVSEAEFLDIVGKAKAAAMEPIVVGAGDRPFTGAYMSYEGLLRKLGAEDYRALLDGKISYKDPRVVEVFEFVKKLVDAGAFPKSVATMTLTDSYAYFFNQKGLLFPQGTWYTQRAFAPAERGGQPDGFQVGIMTFPAMDGGACNTCTTLAVGGGYSINADAENLDLAVAYLKEMATPEMGTLWVVNNYGESGIKSDMSQVTGKFAEYFKDLAQLKEGKEFFIGIQLNFLSGQCRETFAQVVNVAFPAGLIGVDEALSRMDQACYKG
jgi:multiple sugar transport system substrate-binding protein